MTETTIQTMRDEVATAIDTEANSILAFGGMICVTLVHSTLFADAIMPIIARVRAEALEEAAQIAESAINPFEGHRDWDQDNAYYSAADHIAAAIRALEPKP